MSGVERVCDCGTRLRKDNAGRLCEACQRDRSTIGSAPSVPDDFWDEPRMREALDTWHIGKVITAYRRHPFHGKALSQPLVGSWVAMDQSQISRLEAGPIVEDLSKLRMWARVLKIPQKHLWFKIDRVSPLRAAAQDGRIGEAAKESLEFASWALADRIDPLVMEHVQYELRRVAVEYVHSPLRPLFEDLLRLRDVTFGLLRERPNPRQARELFFLTGTNLLLLAHASQNLGESGSGMAQARSAAACAEQADHNGLRAWVAGTQSLIAEWTSRHADAVKFARLGQEYAVTPESRVRLASLEARSLARLGDRERALAALNIAQRSWESATDIDDLNGFGGLLTFPVAKAHYYAGGVFSLLGDHHEAERSALQAIDLYETGPAEDRSYGDEALARIDVALARLARGELDGAEEALRPVLELPGNQRIRQIGDGMARITRVLVAPGYGTSSRPSQLAEAVRDFTLSQPGSRALD